MDDGVQFSILYKGMMSTHHVYTALQVMHDLLHLYAPSLTADFMQILLFMHVLIYCPHIAGASVVEWL